MTTIRFRDQEFERQDGETVLDVLINNKQQPPYSCQRGVCQTCMLKAVKGRIPDRAQEGLLGKLKEQNYFLACLCWPKGDMDVALPNETDICLPATIVNKEMLGQDIYRIQLQTEKSLDYRAGQFINWHHSTELIRSYSLASLPQEDSLLELHIKRKEGGELSNTILDKIAVGDVVEIQGPNGDSYYQVDNTTQNILMIGTGTGLAPLLGIIRDALAHQHTGNIYLYHGARKESGIYGTELLKALTDKYANFHFIQAVSGENTAQYYYGRASEAALEAHSALRNWKVYLCGDPAMVRTTRHKICLAGARFNDVIVDPFEYTELRKTDR